MTEKKDIVEQQTKGWVKALFNFLGITFSVLLAFMLNEWRINARSSQDLNTSRTAIYAELDENYLALRKARDYHLDIYRNLQDLKAGKITQDELRFQGMRSPELQSAAFDVAIQQGTLTRLRSDEFQDIVEIYTKIDSVEQLHTVYMTGAINNLDKVRSDPENMIVFLDSALQDFLYGQEEAMMLIGKVVDKPAFERWYIEIRKPVSD